MSFPLCLSCFRSECQLCNKRASFEVVSARTQIPVASTWKVNTNMEIKDNVSAVVPQKEDARLRRKKGRKKEEEPM